MFSGSTVGIVKAKEAKIGDIIIALIGLPGSGKSSFVHRATQHNEKAVNHGLKSQSPQLHAIRIKYEGVKYVFVETPGIDPSEGGKTIKTILRDLERWLPDKSGIKLTGIIYFHRITDNRITGPPLEEYVQAFSQLCNTDAARGVVLVTTMWDSRIKLDMASKVKRESELKEKYWRGMIGQGATVARFEGSAESAWKIVTICRAEKLQRSQSEQKPSTGGSGRRFMGWLPSRRHLHLHGDLQQRAAMNNPNDMVIALVGTTGAGKSSFINTITKSHTGIGHGLGRCTGCIRAIRYQCPERSSLNISFVDTPGFDERDLSSGEVLDMVLEWLKKTYERDIKVAGILYFHRISDNRVTGAPLQNIHAFEKLCGKGTLQNIILTTTMWDEVEEETGEQREKELQKRYWKAMINQGSKTMRYYNSEESAWSIVERIVDIHNERYAVELQQELVDMKRDLPETKAGQELYGKLQALVARQQDTLQKIRASMKRHDDDAILTALKEEYEDLRKQLEAVIHDMEVLKIRVGKHVYWLYATPLGSAKSC